MASYPKIHIFFAAPCSQMPSLLHSSSKEIITAQSLTIVEEDGSLGSGEDQAAVAELAHTQGLLDAGGDDVQYQFCSGEGG
jgi:hypothetical protein